MPPSAEPSSGEPARKPGHTLVWKIAVGAALLGIAILLSVLVPLTWKMLRPSPGELERQRSLVQAKRIYNACQAFAAVRGKLPATLEELAPDFLADRRELADPGHPEAGEIGYFYFGSGTAAAEPPESVFLASKAEVRGQRVVVRFDGKAREEFLPEKWLRR